MSAYEPYRKGTILIPTGPCDHLHFVCNDPVLYPPLAKECVLAVNISSVDPNLPCDPTCLVEAGEHRFVKHQSYVYYRKADIYGANTIALRVADGTFKTHHDCSDDLFERILAGFGVSPEVRPKIKTFYQKYCC